MFIGLERALFGNIGQGLTDPAGQDYSIIGKYFHDMHVYAHYTVGGNNANFHPIAACSRAVVMGIACSIMANLAIRLIPTTFRNSFRIGLEGGAWMYAASIIYTAAQGWSAATKGDGSSGGKLSSDPCRD
ncbi:MAG: hypothetical protein KDK61_00340 [Simkania sp.]|nr:hypothetical protein [Simkania sp.]